jgi:hypothetical protein
VGISRLEKRQHNRYRLIASVKFTWESDDHRVLSGHGFTRDCSISGALIFSPDRLPTGSILQMEFLLPPLLVAGAGARLKMRGRVVRTVADGFAVVTEMGTGSLLHREPRMARIRSASEGNEIGSLTSKLQ